jgi:general L-amino acid transport system substrate-binding protein
MRTRRNRLASVALACALAAPLAALAACTGAGDEAPADDVAPDAAAITDTMGTDPGASTEDGATDAASAPADAAAPADPAAPAAPAGALLETVRSRGVLRCGVQNELPGFGYLSPEGEYRGFDVDFCRAVAAAVFGDPGAVEFVPLTSQQRFTALQTGEVDVLFRNTTWTLSRDTQNGLDFGPTTFYDGQGMMVRSDAGITDLAGLDGADICVGAGTTTEKNLGDAMRQAGAAFTPVVLEDTPQVFSAYDEGRCDAVTSDKSQLLSGQTTLADPAAHTILDVTMSKEPLGPAVLQGDAQWADVVNWVVLGVVAAEEFGISSTNLADFQATDDPEIRRFLGLEDALGEGLGLAADFMVPVIQGVGNYGEIYDRNLGPDTPFDLPRGVNALWTQGGLLYSPPFR